MLTEYILLVSSDSLTSLIGPKEQEFLYSLHLMTENKTLTEMLWF
jgi:hypothetical protein